MEISAFYNSLFRYANQQKGEMILVVPGEVLQLRLLSVFGVSDHVTGRIGRFSHVTETFIPTDLQSPDTNTIPRWRSHSESGSDDQQCVEFRQFYAVSGTILV